jgi:hypothetical protein
MTASHVYNITEISAACQERLREQPCISPWQKAGFSVIQASDQRRKSQAGNV